jgi:stage IV sporulation protein FB
MKSLNVLPNIHLHPILIIFIIISVITGTFIELFIILSIVFIHELGHFLMARHFKWRIRGMMLWVFGGVLDTDEHGNRSIKEETLVTIAGPFQHVVIHLLLFFLALIPMVPDNIIETAVHYNAIILFFNLIPIWPLDGGKLFMLILSKNLPYKKAYEITIISSIIVSISLLFFQLIFFSFTLSTMMIMLFLIIENGKDWKQRYYVFIRFLLNRYEGSSHVSKVIPIKVPYNLKLMDVFSQFRREIKHSIYINFANHERIVVDETDCLYSYFNEKQHHSQIGEVFNTS